MPCLSKCIFTLGNENIASGSEVGHDRFDGEHSDNDFPQLFSPPGISWILTKEKSSFIQS